MPTKINRELPSDLGLHIVNGITWFKLQGDDGLASQGLHEDLHTSTGNKTHEDLHTSTGNKTHEDLHTSTGNKTHEDLHTSTGNKTKMDDC